MPKRADSKPSLDSTLQQMFDGMLEGVQFVDAEFRYRYLNSAAARHGQRERHELLGQRMQDMYPGIEKTEVFRRIEACLRDCEPQSMLNEFTFPDGSTGWFDLRLSPVNGGVLILSVDISELKRAEAELHRAVDALEEADRRKTELLTMLAHELRNPLAPIQNGLHLLRDRTAHGDDVAVQAIAVMDRQVRHLTTLVNDLLDVTRIVREKVMLVPKRLDLGNLVRECVADYAGVFREKGVSLRADVPQTPVWANGDVARLSQLLASLIDNAGKFTPRGGEVVARITTEGDSATIIIRDTGIGISPDALPFVFEPLFQADTSLDRARGGLGLGLTLARGIVELHRGRIVAESEGAGKGTTVRVTLPREPEPLALTPVSVPAVADARKGRILVIEDNPDAAKSLAMVLGIWGYQVGIARTGTEGVAQARETRPRIILCDIGLPEMDGYAVARALRGDAGTKGARLIAITGYGREEDRRRAMEAGFDLHLAKPVHPDQLKVQLEPVG